MLSIRPTIAHVNLNHLADNIASLKKKLKPNIFFCPMVKGNAYGHGDIQVVQRLKKEGIQSVGVALVEEGIHLRQHKVDLEILSFGVFDAAGAEALLQNSLIPVVSTWKQIQLLEEELKKRGKTSEIHLKFDSGMHRMGFDLTDSEKLLAYFSGKTPFELKGICTHLFTGSDAGDPKGHSREQLRKFSAVEKAFQSLKPISHSLNSAAIVLAEDAWAADQGARPGLAMYGAPPLASSSVTLKPVLSITSQIAQVHKVPKGEGASYGWSWKAKKDSVVGVIPIGYADGYHRTLTNKAPILFRGKRVLQVGNVCMDYIMVDVTEALKGEEISQLIGEKVTLLGKDGAEEITSDDLAKLADTISYEIMTSVSARVPKKYIGEV